MALPRQIPFERTPIFMKKPENPEQSLLKHYCKINIYENPIDDVQTGLMCDVDNCIIREPAAIKRLIAAGMTIARIVLKDLEPNEGAQLIQCIRQGVFSYSTDIEYVYPVAIVVEIKSPYMVTGNVNAGPKARVKLLKHARIKLTNDCDWRDRDSADCIYVACEHLKDLTPGAIVFIDSLSPGRIKLVVCDVGKNSVECKVVNGGIFGPKMNVRFAQAPQELGHLSKVKVRSDEEDFTCDNKTEPSFASIEEQMEFAIAYDMDGVLVSNVQFSDDISKIKKILSPKGKHILVFACIESALGVDNIDEVLKEADGIFLDRNILSTDLPVEKVFIAQKMILSKCNETGKPCICKGVLNEVIPSLCVTDIANLVIDGADVVSLEMHYDSPLTKISSTSRFAPLTMAERCLTACSVICRHAERIIWQPKMYGNLELIQSLLKEPTKAICVSAIELAMRSRAAVIICLTTTGRTATMLAQVRSRLPIVAVTRECHTARQLRFWRGIRAMHYFEKLKTDYLLEVESRIRAGLDYCKAKNILRCGDAYVIMTASRKDLGYCDSVRLLYASSRRTTGMCIK